MLIYCLTVAVIELDAQLQQLKMKASYSFTSIYSIGGEKTQANIFNDSEKPRYPEHDKAEYSPKEWPAKYFALFKSKLNSFFTTLNIE